MEVLACLYVLPENPGFGTVFKYNEAVLFQFVYLKDRNTEEAMSKSTKQKNEFNTTEVRQRCNFQQYVTL